MSTSQDYLLSIYMKNPVEQNTPGLSPGQEGQGDLTGDSLVQSPPARLLMVLQMFGWQAAAAAVLRMGRGTELLRRVWWKRVRGDAVRLQPAKEVLCIVLSHRSSQD